MELDCLEELSFPVVKCIDVVVELLSFVFVLWRWEWYVVLLNHDVIVRVV